MTLPQIDVLLKGLGLAELPAEGLIHVNADFLRYIISQLASKEPFDPFFYAQQLGGVTAFDTEGLHQHFIEHGYFEGIMGSPPLFDAPFYRASNPDLAGLEERDGTAGMIRHYSQHGRAEGRAGSTSELSLVDWSRAAQAASAKADSLVLLDRKIANARVQPLRTPHVPENFRGGVVLTEAKDTRLRHSHGSLTVDGFAPVELDDVKISGDWIYAGFAYPHFGHFMAECAHRILPSLERFDCKRWLFVGQEADMPLSEARQLPSYIQDVLRYFGIALSDVAVLHRDATVETLFVVEQASTLGGGPKPNYTRHLKRVSDAKLMTNTRPEKIFVSRKGLPPGGSLLGECYIESLLDRSGFMIFQPEKFSVQEQMRLYKSASVIVFPEGSACHGVELLGEGDLESVYLIARRNPHFALFSAILEPRANKFTIVNDFENLGSLAVNETTGETLDYLSISILRHCALETLMHNLGCQIDENSATQYRLSIIADLDTYIDYYSARLGNDKIPLTSKFRQNCLETIERLFI